MIVALNGRWKERGRGIGDKYLIVFCVVDSLLIHTWMIYERCVRESRFELRKVGNREVLASTD